MSAVESLQPSCVANRWMSFSASSFGKAAVELTGEAVVLVTGGALELTSHPTKLANNRVNVPRDNKIFILFLDTMVLMILMKETEYSDKLRVKSTRQSKLSDEQARDYLASLPATMLKIVGANIVPSSISMHGESYE